MPRERSSLLPLVMSPSGGMSASLPAAWGPPPPYEEVIRNSSAAETRPLSSEPLAPNYRLPSEGPVLNPHPFSPTITSVDPVAVFRHHQTIATAARSSRNNGRLFLGSSSHVSSSSSNSSTPNILGPDHSFDIRQPLRQMSSTSMLPPTTRPTFGIDLHPTPSGRTPFVQRADYYDDSFLNSFSLTPDEDYEEDEEDELQHCFAEPENTSEPVLLSKVAASVEPEVKSRSQGLKSSTYSPVLAPVIKKETMLKKLSARNNRSLPSTPLLHIRRLMQKVKTGKSVESISNINYCYDSEEEQKDASIDDECAHVQADGLQRMMVERSSASAQIHAQCETKKQLLENYERIYLPGKNLNLGGKSLPASPRKQWVLTKAKEI